MHRLTLADGPRLQRLLERCADYYAMAEGRPAEPGAAIEELTTGPDGFSPDDIFCFGYPAAVDELAGMIGALRNHRRSGQWYLGLMLLDPLSRGGGLGTHLYGAFEGWVRLQGADSVLLAVVETNIRATRFWKRMGFGWPRCYPERSIGLRRHILIEYEKDLGGARNGV